MFHSHYTNLSTVWNYNNFIHPSLVQVSALSDVLFFFFPFNKSISGCAEKRLSSLRSRLNVTSESQLNQHSPSVLPARTQICNSSRQPWNIPHAVCRMSGCPLIIYVENTFDLLSPFLFCGKRPIKSFDCLTLSPSPAVILEPLWPACFKRSRV